MERIRVLIVDDDSDMLEAIHAFVEMAEDLQVVGEAMNGEVAVRQTRALRPDVVVMDMQMPVLDGVGALTQIKEFAPETGVLALTTFTTDRYVVPALRAGASGYLVKDAPPDEIAEAIRATYRGDSTISPVVLKHVVDDIAQDRRPSLPATPPAAADSLSKRERDVITLLARGHSNREIAEALILTESTIKSHIARLTVKLGVRDRVQAVIRAHEWGLAELHLQE